MSSSADSTGLLDRLARSLDDLDRQRLQARFANVPMTAIADAPRRVPARFGGEVREQRRSSPGEAPWLRLVIDDGTGSVIAHFTGRMRLHGVVVGRALLLEGVLRDGSARPTVMNPAYTIID